MKSFFIDWHFITQHNLHQMQHPNSLIDVSLSGALILPFFGADAAAAFMCMSAEEKRYAALSRLYARRRTRSEVKYRQERAARCSRVLQS